MPTNDNSEDSVLATAAKNVGKAMGKVAGTMGVESGDAAVATNPTPKKEKVGKLQKKNKDRLPRREKKALQKAAAKQARAQQ